MTLKGTLLPDHIAVNKFQLVIAGLPSLTPVTVGGFNEELNTVDLPDRTRASGGNTAPVEIPISLPAHHSTEIAAMEVWFNECKDPVLLTYKKVATLIVTSISGAKTRSYTLIGLFVTARGTPDLDMANDGEQANVDYTLSADEVIPI